MPWETRNLSLERALEFYGWAVKGIKGKGKGRKKITGAVCDLR